jgi:DNA-binding PadR family transcriptional regulator
MSPVFRHGGLRLYLLKLLDEAPRHGYEVIRLLQDRFLGVYSPSPGTIYPRLARLEEEGLVTHDEIDGKKVYRITDKGREEINSRLDDLAELEEELTESVRDIAREVSEDVRDTVRNLREELTYMTKDVRREAREQSREDARERVKRARDEVRESARRARDEARQGRQQAHGPDPDAGTDARDAARQAREALREEARRARQSRQERDRRARQEGAHGTGAHGTDTHEKDAHGADAHGPDADGPDAHGASPRDWADWASSQGWPSWTGWRGRSGDRPWGAATGGGRGGRWPGPSGLDAALFRDLERLALDFGRELRKAAWNTESVGENALGDLRSILEDALTRIKDEVFGDPGDRAGDRDQEKDQEKHPERPDSAES